MVGKIDFIICEHDGMWFNQSHNVPKNVALKTDEEIIQWVKAHGLIEDDYYYVGVYWRDPNIIQTN